MRHSNTEVYSIAVVTHVTSTSDLKNKRILTPYVAFVPKGLSLSGHQNKQEYEL